MKDKKYGINYKAVEMMEGLHFAFPGGSTASERRVDDDWESVSRLGLHEIIRGGESDIGTLTGIMTATGSGLTFVILGSGSDIMHISDKGKAMSSSPCATGLSISRSKVSVTVVEPSGYVTSSTILRPCGVFSTVRVTTVPPL
jgi:hypothetical protein